MRTFNNLPMHNNVSAESRRAFDWWIKASAVIGSMLAAGLVTISLIGPTSARLDHAVSPGTKAPAFSASKNGVERSGVLTGYKIVF